MASNPLLQRLFAHEVLDRATAHRAMLDLSTGALNDAEVAAFCSVYLMRAVGQAELAGFRDALLELGAVLPEALRHGIDLCGTGGDGKDTFNISTLSAFVVAGAGGRVVKHGNHGSSSGCGSSTVLEFLGCTFTADPDVLQRSLEETGVCYLHAPLFHPALKRVAAVRRELGVRTFFNLLGPLVNAARPTHQLVGVSQLGLARTYRYLMQGSGITYTVLHGLDGYDEVSLTGAVHVADAQGERLLEPSDLGLPTYAQHELQGGATVEEAAYIFNAVLDNSATAAQRDVVVANAALALRTQQGGSLSAAVQQAQEALASGKARSAFRAFRETHQPR